MVGCVEGFDRDVECVHWGLTHSPLLLVQLKKSMTKSLCVGFYEMSQLVEGFQLHSQCLPHNIKRNNYNYQNQNHNQNNKHHGKQQATTRPSSVESTLHSKILRSSHPSNLCLVASDFQVAHSSIQYVARAAGQLLLG